MHEPEMHELGAAAAAPESAPHGAPRADGVDAPLFAAAPHDEPEFPDSARSAAASSSPSPLDLPPRNPHPLAVAQAAPRVSDGAARRAPSRFGRMRPGVALLFGAVAIGVVAWGAQQLGASVSAAELTRVDPTAVRLASGAAWSDPRWDAEIEQILRDLPPFPCEDAAARELVRTRISALCFVREVGAPEVVWPDGLSVPITLRQPVACIGQASGGAAAGPSGQTYWLVADDGMILSGRWPTPPVIGGRALPVLLGEHGGVAGARPGQRLASSTLLDALAVASELTQYLAPPQLDALGSVAIDARGASEAAVDKPGIQILLEDQRLIAFGRSPLARAPGELPVARKWASIARGLDALRTQDQRFDWELLDVRWDVPAWRLRDSDATDASAGATAHDEPRRGG